MYYYPLLFFIFNKILTDFDISLMLSEIKELNSEQELLKDKHDTIYNTIINDDALAINEFNLHQLTNLNYLNLTYNYIPNTNIA